jgi:hypothetical protein
VRTVLAGLAGGGISAALLSNGTVLAQSPAAGTHVNLGSAVSITIGTPPKHPCP